MANIHIIGKKGSKSKLQISKETGIKLYRGTPADIIINYGLAGKKLTELFKKYPKASGIPILNKYVGQSKYNVIKMAEDNNIPVPESKLLLSKSDKTSDWIEKRLNSSMGIGIKRAKQKSRIFGKYYQRMIQERKFELRVHSFLWIPKEEWVLQKRTGPDDQIAWNFHQGGHFSNVLYPNKYSVFLESKEISEKILQITGMAFGAVDLIVDKHSEVYFIEVNSAPGFTEFSENIYITAFNRLKLLTKSKLKALCDRNIKC